MKRTNRIRNSGLITMAAAVLWIVSITMEYRYDLKPPGSGALYNINQVMFIVAILGYIVGILGLAWSHAAGIGRFGKISLGLFGGGDFLIMIATIWSTLTGNNENPLFPIGGLAASLGALLSGIAVAIARTWVGWQRWSVAIYALYYWSALFLPLLIANQEPNQLTETIWGLAWMLIGYAIYTSCDKRNLHT